MKVLYILLVTFIGVASFGQCYTEISVNMTNIILKKQDNTIWGCGISGWGALVNTNPDFEPSFIQVGSFADVANVETGGRNTFAIRTNGTLWGAGCNVEGALGIGSLLTIVQTFQQITTQTGWQKVDGNFDTTLAIRNGGVWGWGSNDTRQMGQSTPSASQLTPIAIGNFTDVMDVTIGGLAPACVALRSNGTLWGWGSNSTGVLMQGSSTTSVPTPTALGTDTNWAKIAQGSDHILALKTNGTLWAWGAGEFGQCGDTLPPLFFRNSPGQIGTDTDWVEVAAGLKVSYGIKANGTLWSWGLHENGQLGTGATADQLFPTQVGTATNWAKIYSKWNFTVGVKTDGSLWAWGNNDFGTFGNGTVESSAVPVQIPGVCVLSTLPAFEEDEVLVASNPSRAEFYVGASFDYRLTLMDVHGKVVATYNDMQDRYSLSGLPSGVYIVAVENMENGKVVYEKVVR